MFYPNSRIVVIVGHYGSGKSELAINLALLQSAIMNQQQSIQDKVRAEGDISAARKSIYIVDLDIVNPYFRSREKADFLMSQNIGVISSAEDFPAVDLPYMPGEIAKVFKDEETMAVIDAGGDPAGARVLARYAKDIKDSGAQVYMVINGNRPLTKEPGEIIKYMNDISGAANVRINGIINNTHLLGKTEPEDIYRGALVAKEVSDLTGVPMVGHAVEKSLIPQVEFRNAGIKTGGSDEVVIEPIIPIDIYLKKPWED